MATTAEKAKIEQIVSEFYAKSLHIILDSRIPFISAQNNPDESHHSSSASSPASRSTDRWFNLEMDSCPAVQEKVESWRRGSVEPMVVDVLLQQPMGGAELPAPSCGWPQVYKGSSPSRGVSGGASWNVDGDGCSSPDGCSRTLLERWVVHYDRRKKVGSSAGGSGKAPAGFGEVSGSGRAGDSIGGGGTGLGNRGSVGGGPLPPFPSTHALERPVVYKRTVIMLRSLYCTARTLPAHRLFRLVNSSSHSRSFTLSYRVSSSPPPLSEADEVAMMTCSLTPIETMWGRMCVSVAYRHTTAVTALEITPPILPRIISDYVGSPTTDPLRRFTNVGSVPSGGISGRRGVHVVSLPSSVPSSPSGASFGRRHSWSGGQGKVQAAPGLISSPSCRVSRSPSPSQPLDFNPSPPLAPSPYSSSPSANNPLNHSPRSSPSHPTFSQAFTSQPPSFHQTGSGTQPISILDRGQSPPFSASPSPSPPTPHHHSQDAVFSRGLRSAPVSIPRPSSAPRPGLSANPRLLIADGSTQQHQPSRCPYPPPSPQSRNLDPLPRALASNSRLWSGQVPNIDVPGLEGKNAPRLSISTLAESSLLISPPHPYHGNQAPGEEKSEEGPPSGVKRSLYGPPRLTLGSRGISKGGIPDDVDDEEFSCPFAVSDDEAEEYRSRIESPGSRAKPALEAFESIGQPHQRSQDAAVGALVMILRSAPPLRQWTTTPFLKSGSPSPRQHGVPSLVVGYVGTSGKLKVSPPRPINSKTISRPTSVVGSPSSLTSAGGKFVAKTSGFALEELRSYMEMRDHLLRQGGGKFASSPTKPT